MVNKVILIRVSDKKDGKSWILYSSALILLFALLLYANRAASRTTLASSSSDQSVDLQSAAKRNAIKTHKELDLSAVHPNPVETIRLTSSLDAFASKVVIPKIT